MKRGRAATLIDRVRCLLALGEPAVAIERVLSHEFNVPPLTRCPGAAHGRGDDGGAHADDCPSCKPRWGVVGDVVKIT